MVERVDLRQEKETLLDSWAAEFLAAHPDGLVLHLACGLDSRPLRVARPASAAWIDVDYPDVIALRRRLYDLPAGVTTIGTSVTEPEWWHRVGSMIHADCATARSGRW